MSNHHYHYSASYRRNDCKYGDSGLIELNKKVFEEGVYQAFFESMVIDRECDKDTLIITSLTYMGKG